MSWRARMVEDYAYFPKPYPLGPGLSKNNASKIRSKPNKDVQVVPQKSTLSTLSTKTTLSGFPLKVRHRIDGKPEQEDPYEDLPTSRLAHYHFTYGLSEEDEQQFRSQLPSQLEMTSMTRGQGQTSVPVRKRTSNSAGISERLKEIKQSFHKADQLPRPYHPKPYFQDWGQAEVGADQEWDTEKSEMMLNSTQKILNHNALNEGWASYFEGLDEMDRTDDDSDFGHVSLAELDQGRAAFQPSLPKPSRLQPKTYYTVERPGTSRLVSVASLNKNRTSTVSAAPSSLSKKSSKKVRTVEPDATLFIKPPPLNPSHGDKIIQKQLQKEAAASLMTSEQYSKRKKELMEAALQVYDRDLPTYEVMSDIREAALEAEEQNNAASRQNVMDLLYHALTNQATSITMKSPSTSLHLSSPYSTDRRKLPTISRPLDQFNGPVVSTILRELQESSAGGPNFPYREIAPANISRISRRSPPVRKQSKEKIKALRVLENYDLSKLRQRKYMTPKPVLTLLSVKNTRNQLSNYSRVGGTTGPERDPGNTTSGPSRERSHIRADEEINTTRSRSGGSLTALSNLQTRNEKYNTGKTRVTTAAGGTHKRQRHH